MTNRLKGTLCNRTQHHGTRCHPLVMYRHRRAKAKVRDQVTLMPIITWEYIRSLLVLPRRRCIQPRTLPKMSGMRVDLPAVPKPRGSYHQPLTLLFIKA